MNSITATPAAKSGTFPVTARPLGTWTYAVTSSSRPGVTHTVDMLARVCSCEAGQRGRECRHIRLIDSPDEYVRALVPPTPRQVTVAALEQAEPCHWCARPAGASGYCSLHVVFADCF